MNVKSKKPVQEKLRRHTISTSNKISKPPVHKTPKRKSNTSNSKKSNLLGLNSRVPQRQPRSSPNTSKKIKNLKSSSHSPPVNKKNVKQYTKSPGKRSLKSREKQSESDDSDCDSIPDRYEKCRKFLEDEFANIIGLTEVKAMFFALLKTMFLNMKRQKMGVDPSKFHSYLHMAFVGNPGVGKTMIARLVGKLYKKLKVLSKGHVVEVQRTDLVAEYIGQTGPKTYAKIVEAKGGILFVDEAYRLKPPNSDKDFGSEAIDEIMRHMDDPDLIIIFAGYPREMKRFMESNPGMQRRTPYVIEFKDYTIQELAEIMQCIVRLRQYTLNVDTKRLMELIATYSSSEQRSKENGGLAKNIIDNACKKLDLRLPLNASGKELLTLTEEDIIASMKDFQKKQKIFKF